MGTLRAILEQSYLLLKGNMGFVFSLVLELLRLVASGGSGVVNLFLGIVVYFTALFYLLSESSDIYKPVELISELGTSVGDGFSAALTKAVKSIFKITFKMAAFYGMFTYLTHTLFNVSIVMVPVLAATFLAAVPVAGQYVVPVPGALELWLADDRLGAAILLVLVHTAPMMVVDATVYSEVKKGIHPWITGLSIVGGIYYFGVPGAIYGPLLVCAVFVLLSMYTGRFCTSVRVFRMTHEN
jgi:predicted PurR-regulated permease PerM